METRVGLSGWKVMEGVEMRVGLSFIGDSNTVVRVQPTSRSECDGYSGIGR